MAVLRSSNMLMRRFARPVPPVFRIRPVTASLQRRMFASNLDADLPQVQRNKAENGGEKRLGPFDLSGKVFVVTGTKCRSIYRAHVHLWLMLKSRQAEVMA